MSDKLEELTEEVEKEIKPIFEKIERICETVRSDENEQNT